MNRPLVITQDDDLLDDLLRISAAAGAELDVAHTAAHCRPYWAKAPLVIVGHDMADAVAALDPPPRSRVLLVTRHMEEDPDIWRRCVAVGAQRLMTLPSAERCLAEEFADLSLVEDRAGAVVCVVGGQGGAGASVLAASLASAAARLGGRAALLVDADPLGGGLDALLGRELRDGARWGDLLAREGRVNPGALRAVLPSVGDLAVLAFHRGDARPVPAKAMRSVLEAGRRGFDLVVVDLPRHIDAAAIEALARAATTLLVVPAHVRGVLAAAQVLSVLRPQTGDIRAVLRPGVLDEAVVTASLNVPSSGILPNHPRLTTAIDNGSPLPVTRRTPLGRFCGTLLPTLLPDPEPCP